MGSNGNLELTSILIKMCCDIEYMRKVNIDMLCEKSRIHSYSCQ